MFCVSSWYRRGARRIRPSGRSRAGYAAQKGDWTVVLEQTPKMPRLLLLMPTRSYRTGDFMQAASRLKLDIVVASDEGQPLADLMPGRSLTTDFADPQRGADQIARFADAYPLDAIVAVDDAGALLAARAAALLKLPMNSVPAVESTRNKAILRERLAAAGLPSPAFRVCRLDDDSAPIAAELVATKRISLASSNRSRWPAAAA